MNKDELRALFSEQKQETLNKNANLISRWGGALRK